MAKKKSAFPKVTEVALYSSITGKKIRKVTSVDFGDGCKVGFLEKLPARLAIPQAREICRKRKASGPGA